MNQRTIGFIGMEKQYSIFSSWLHDNPSFGFQLTRIVEPGFSESLDGLIKQLEQLLSVSPFDEILVGSFERRKDVLTVIVDATQADEIFGFIFSQGEINKPGGGFIYQTSLTKASDYKLPGIEG